MFAGRIAEDANNLRLNQTQTTLGRKMKKKRQSDRGGGADGGGCIVPVWKRRLSSANVCARVGGLA